MILSRGLISMRTQSQIKLTLLLTFVSFVGNSSGIFSVAQAQAQAPAQNNPIVYISKMYGEVSIQTNYVDRGITQSNKLMSVSGGGGYWFGGLGRIGFNAASVSYPNETANSEIRGFAEYRFIFSSNSDLRLRNDLIRYYSDNLRNNTLITLAQNFFGYHILYLRDDNFEGTKTHRNWFGFQNDLPLSPRLDLTASIGYSVLEVPGYNNFFDTRIGINYTVSNITASLVNTLTSEASQFNGKAGFMIFLVLAAKF